MIAYFDCFSGISGDMTLGALIDLGVPVEWLKDSLRKIPLSGFDLRTESISRKGIGAVRVIVETKDDKASRDYAEIKALIENSPLEDRIKKPSLDIFDKLAAAEAGIHGCPKEHVHFHEIGGIDAIVDIAGVSLCLDYLGIKTVVASNIRVGTGFVSCEHGTLPVPAPATLEILRGAPVQGTGIPHELVTPTGAAIVVTLAESFGSIPNMTVDKIGYGGGKRDLEATPNVLRIVLGTASSEYLADRIVVVETCIDDMNPEFFGFMMDRLFQDGALDVYWVPVFMKKNRPGTQVQVLCRQERKHAVIKRILSESTSLGVRIYDVDRQMLARDSIKINSVFGEVQIKRITGSDGTCSYTPEYEACKRIALEKNIPLKNVYETLLRDLPSS
jgi:uncharacterized protein (TIGR00299 family) protein